MLEDIGMEFKYNGHNQELLDGKTPNAELTGLELELFKVIDDIDGYSDVARDNYKMYQSLVMERIKRFHEAKLTASDCKKVYRIVDVDHYDWTNKTYNIRTADALRDALDKVPPDATLCTSVDNGHDEYDCEIKPFMVSHYDNGTVSGMVYVGPVSKHPN